MISRMSSNHNVVLTSSGMSQLSSGIPFNSSPLKRNSSLTFIQSPSQRHKYSYSSSSTVTMDEDEDEQPFSGMRRSFFIRVPSYYRLPK